MSDDPRSPVQPKKSLGQHFLTDEEVIWQIAQAVMRQVREGGDGASRLGGTPAEGVSMKDVPPDAPARLVEIGPGTGALTRELLAGCPELTAVETDPRMVRKLEQEFGAAHPGFKVLHRDVLRADWSEWIRPGTVLAGNLPYYATSPILFTTLEHRRELKAAVFMVQKEVADRITAAPGTREYGILSVQLQLLSTPRQVLDVPPEAFDPPPNVDSAVVSLVFDRPPLPCQDRTLKMVVRTAFQQRRKKMSNALRSLLDPARFPEFDFSLRPDAWTPQMYARLAEQFEKLATTDSGNVKT